MAKINLTDEILKHTDEEIIEYLYTLSASLFRIYSKVDDPNTLMLYYGDVEQIYAVLRALKQRNDSRSPENDL